MGRHLTENDRYHIEKELGKKVPVADIAKDLGVHRATVYKEIKRGTFVKRDHVTWKDVTVYGYDVGQRVHDERKHKKGAKKKLEPDDAYLLRVKDLIINQKYSPEAVHYIVEDNKVCIKTLYNYIHAEHVKGLTINNLPYARPKKKKTAGKKAKRLPGGKSIEQRSGHVLDKKEYGHWEMDTVYSSRDDKTCLLVLSERMTRDELIFKIKDRTTKSVLKALDRYEKKIGSPAFRHTFKTITCDNGVEFADWQSIERSCRTKGKRTELYYCHPYSSWERGLNENQNRFIRRWIPKGDDIGLYSAAEIQQLQDWLNNYPRSIFNGLSAKEYFNGLVNKLTVF